jgi:hypothetical protein
MGYFRADFEKEIQSIDLNELSLSSVAETNANVVNYAINHKFILNSLFN